MPRTTLATTGSPPRRGDIWWILADKRRPAVIVQTDRLSDPRITTFLVAPLTSRLHLAGLPGNVALDRRVSGLGRDCVANLYDLQKVIRSDLIEFTAHLPSSSLRALDDGLRLVLGLDE